MRHYVLKKINKILKYKINNFQMKSKIFFYYLIFSQFNAIHINANQIESSKVQTQSSNLTRFTRKVFTTSLILLIAITGVNTKDSSKGPLEIGLVKANVGGIDISIFSSNKELNVSKVFSEDSQIFVETTDGKHQKAKILDKIFKNWELLVGNVLYSRFNLSHNPSINKLMNQYQKNFNISGDDLITEVLLGAVQTNALIISASKEAKDQKLPNFCQAIQGIKAAVFEAIELNLKCLALINPKCQKFDENGVYHSVICDERGECHFINRSPNKDSKSRNYEAYRNFAECYG